MGNCFCLKPNNKSHPKGEEEEKEKEKEEQSAASTNTVPSNIISLQISRDQVDSHHQQQQQEYYSHNNGKVSDHKNCSSTSGKNVVRLRIVMTQQELDEFLSNCRSSGDADSNNKNNKLVINNNSTTIVQQKLLIMNAKMNSNKVNNNSNNTTISSSSSSSNWRPNLESIPE